MDDREAVESAVEILQQLGLKEYEARCLVGLSRTSAATAKQLSEITEVPRTRVYDSIRVLEAEGLVEVQHSNPQRYRAVPMAEATATLRDKYDERVRRLSATLERVEPVETGAESPVQAIWSMSGRDAIEARANGMIADAEEEIVLVVGEGTLLTEALVEVLNDLDDEIALLVGALTESLEHEVADRVPRATAFVSGLGWLRGDDAGDTSAIGRLVLVDRSKLLVSTVHPETGAERAIFGEGFGNGIVVIARRIMAQGLLPARDASG